jgi:hypothetical protein
MSAGRGAAGAASTGHQHLDVIANLRFLVFI